MKYSFAATAIPRAVDSPRLALDVEKLNVVKAGKYPNDEPTCQVLIIGGGLGGVAAAEDLAERGISVIIAEPTSHLGGQLTAQGLCTPDQDRWINKTPGTGSPHYRSLMSQIAAYYSTQQGIVPSHAANIGQCWVGLYSAEPKVWESSIEARLAPLMRPTAYAA
jgi:hypothetical protein